MATLRALFHVGTPKMSTAYQKLPRTHQEALQLGEKRYFTGRPCKNGHIAYRVTANKNCAKCNREGVNKWRENNREKARKNVYTWRKNNVERFRAHRDAWRAKKYNVTRERPDVCEICGQPPSGKRRLCLDHCHKSGQFRGWLCNGCNTLLGFAQDDIRVLQAAIAYLEAHDPI